MRRNPARPRSGATRETSCSTTAVSGTPWRPTAAADNRVALIVRYAPWWLNLTPTMRGTPDNQRMVLDTGGKNYDAIPIRREVFESLPENVKPLYRHWVQE